jgi:hypothetical protein
VYKVKTFGTTMEIFHVHKELGHLDEEVNTFLAARPQAELIGISDMPITDDAGKTVGMVRVLAYKE